MSIIENLVRIFAPHICIGCGTEEDALLCEGCMESLPMVPSRCYRCQVVTDSYLVCGRCQDVTPLRRVAASTPYDSLARELVHHMKYERAQAGATEMARLMAELMNDLPTDVVLVPVPTASSRVRARGYDHTSLLARHIAASTGIPRSKMLARIGQAHQMGARRADRLRQLEGAFRPVHLKELQGKHIVLIDDVLTTGATLETAARILKQYGARQVDAAVFAQA